VPLPFPQIVLLHHDPLNFFHERTLVRGVSAGFEPRVESALLPIERCAAEIANAIRDAALGDGLTFPTGFRGELEEQVAFRVRARTMQ